MEVLCPGQNLGSVGGLINAIPAPLLREGAEGVPVTRLVMGFEVDPNTWTHGALDDEGY